MREEAGGHLAARYDALHNGASVWHRKKESVRDGVACQQAHMQQQGYVRLRHPLTRLVSPDSKCG